MTKITITTTVPGLMITVRSDAPLDTESLAWRKHLAAPPHWTIELVDTPNKRTTLVPREIIALVVIEGD